MKKIKQFLFVILQFTTYYTLATNYYVSPAGSNSNNGLTAATAYQTLQFAANQTCPGDTVFAMSGIYTNLVPATNVLSIDNSGTSAHWIVNKNFPGHTPVIKIHDQWCRIAVQGSDYITIENNVVSKCAWYSPYGNSAITLFQLYNNCQSPSIQDGELTVYTADSIWFINNIAWPDSGRTFTCKTGPSINI